MSNHQHCINCLTDSKALYQYPCKACNWSPKEHSGSGLYLSPGTILHGQYQIAKMLGHGGFGITYLAWDNLLEIKLAVKEYMPRDFATRNSTNSEVSAFAGDAQANFAYGLERFLDEARTLAKFQQHNGIVSVLNVFYGNGTGYMVMEYVDGLTLKEYLVKNDKLTWEQTLKLFMPVMDALREVHKYGMLHRDISPDNIYLCQDSRIKLLDFGSARYALGGHSRSLSVVVKPGYAPEEQYRTKGKQGPWTDVYSVAASMYRCVTGLVPPDALDRLDEDELVKPSKLGIKIPVKAEEELMSALAIKSTNRTQTIESFQNGLSGQMRSEPISTKPLPPIEKPIEPAIPNLPEKDNSLYFWGAVIVVLGIVIFKIQEPSNQNTNSVVNTPEQVAVSSPPVTVKEDVNLAMSAVEQNDEGVKFQEAKDYKQAIKLYRLAADRGLAMAQFNLGTMYENGGEVAKDLKQAFKWYQLAANQGNVYGQQSLGIMYFSGKGTKKDYMQAIKWFRKAADQGNKNGQYSIGYMYVNGLGVAKDISQALYWYELAAAQGDKDAEKRIKEIALINQKSLSNEPTDAKELNALATNYVEKKKYKEAVTLYQKSADQGNAYGQSKLGTLYAKGQGVKKNPKEAIKLYLLSANQGFVEAQNNLGVMYFNGIGVSKNQEEAIKWFKLAADQGDIKSIKVLKEIAASDEVVSTSETVTNSEQASYNQQSYKIGDKLPDGSVVFYIDASGEHGLVAKPNDSSSEVNWTIAMQTASKLGSGWRLPSKDELNLLYQQKYVVGGFPNGYYWSSTESEDDGAWYQYFNDGFQGHGTKTGTCKTVVVQAC